MKIQKFEDLEIWKKSLTITKIIYDITSQKEFSKDFELKNQIRRAIISVSSCIVEGFEKNNNNEFKRFLSIAKGSCGEVRNQCYIALTVGHISLAEFNKIDEELLILGKQIGSFMSYLESIKIRKFNNSQTR